MIGFYVAETLRQTLGGEHGWVSDGQGSRCYGMRLPDGALVWPVGRAGDRLRLGAEANLYHYVVSLIRA